jgi:TonB family protein
MLGLVASLSLTIALVHLPFRSAPPRVGWSTHTPAEQVVLEDVTTERSDTERSDDAAKRRKEAPPATDFRSPDAESETTSASSESSGTESTERDSDGSRTYEEIQSIAELGVSDRTPRIVGGAGSLYLHINYPEKARMQGIEGRLQLEFTVETDGTVADMVVAKSLHPLCDSAAVEGVRSVTFVPAKRDGTPIPIRLRLPIRFQLTTVSSSVPSNGTKP